jgi:Dolichyl-phosphate-mannose-protein mannosyltransferase
MCRWWRLAPPRILAMAQTEEVAQPVIRLPEERPSPLKALFRHEAVRDALSIWLLTRALFVLLTYFGVILFSSTLHGPHPSFIHQLLPRWSQWDAQWYVNIARRGYAWRNPAGTSPTAFFPLYPMLIRAVVALTHRSYETAALVISNLAFFGALIYLWLLANRELGRERAHRTILYVAVFPTALFFFAGYTESLFLLLTVASFYHIRRHDWLLAGLLGGLASATRVTGILLVLPYAFEYARGVDFSWRRIDLRTIWILLIPVGLIAFMLYLNGTVHDSLAFTHDQAAWQKIFTPRLWAGILESLRQIFVVEPKASFLEAHNILNLSVAFLFLAWSYFAARRFGLTYGLYLLGFWILTLSTPAMAGGYPVPLISLSRYVLSLFPVFMYMAMLGDRRGFHEGYLVVSTAMLGLLTVQFLNPPGWVI